jgi:pimeloyl-ACP methyl ester carboxylesterase
VLVGHSYGGMVISGAAERMAEKIKSLVVLDGFVPEDGKAMREYWPASVMSYLDKEASISGGVSVPPLPAESLAVETENREWVDNQVSAPPYGTFNEVIRLSGARDGIAKKTYIRAAKFRSHPFDAVVKRLQSDAGWRTLTIESGHVPMVDEPLRLAELLAQTA